jgi:hypothetical protein
MRTFKLLPLLILTLLWMPAVVHAQDSLRFETMQIDLWPEYDQPAMLVIYRASLTADTQLPVEVGIRIPAAVGEPNAVAVRQDGGQPFNAEYTRVEDGEWATIFFSARFREIQIEYYDPGIERQGDTRQYQFVWPGDYAIDNLRILVQQPTGAENVTTFPRLSSITQDAFGLSYYGGEIGSVAAGETFDLTITYDKQTDDLTVNFLPIDSSEPVSFDTAGRLSLTEMLPWGVGILGVLVVLIGVTWYWVTGRKANGVRPVKRRRAPRRKVMEPELHEMETDDRSVFCHQCGKRAISGDKFCRACGTKLRL